MMQRCQKLMQYHRYSSIACYLIFFSYFPFEFSRRQEGEQRWKSQRGDTGVAVATEGGDAATDSNNRRDDGRQSKWTTDFSNKK
jgi:hypothetical protein